MYGCMQFNSTTLANLLVGHTIRQDTGALSEHLLHLLIELGVRTLKILAQKRGWKLKIAEHKMT